MKEKVIELKNIYPVNLKAEEYTISSILGTDALINAMLFDKTIGEIYSDNEIAEYTGYAEIMRCFTMMPDITDYTYNPETGTTTIIWSDNTTTTVTAEDPATADQYTDFMIAYAKKAAGNTSRIQSIYERAIKLPEKKALAEQKAKEQEEEQEKIRENQKARKRRQRVRREARRRKEEYEKSLIREEAKRLAEKEYGVPYDKNDWLKTNEDKGHETT